MLARNSEGLLEGEYPRDSGITIKEVVNLSKGVAYGGSYEVTVPAKVRGRGNGRLRKRFKELSDGKRFAEHQHKGLGERGKAFFKLDSQKQDEVAGLVPLLEESEWSLDDLKSLLKTAEQYGFSLSEVSSGLTNLGKHGLGVDRSVRYCTAHLLPNQGAVTLGEVVGELVVLKKQRMKDGDLRPQSVEDFSQRSNRLVGQFGDRPIEMITREEITSWIGSLGLSLRSNENFVRHAVEVFNFATEEGYIGLSPLAGFKGAKRKALTGSGRKTAPIGFLEVEQSEKLLNAAVQHQELGLLGCVALGLFCGLRTEEIKRLDWSEIKMTREKPVVTITAEKSKKWRTRHVDIPPNALRFLTLCEDSEGPVVKLNEQDDTKRKNEFNNVFRKLLNRAGLRRKEDGKWVSDWKQNAMRHSFGTYHCALHENPSKTAMLMGHIAGDIRTFYNHYRALVTKEEGEAFFSIVPPKSESKVVEFAG